MSEDLLKEYRTNPHFHARVEAFAHRIADEKVERATHKYIEEIEEVLKQRDAAIFLVTTEFELNFANLQRENDFLRLMFWSCLTALIVACIIIFLIK